MPLCALLAILTLGLADCHPSRVEALAELHAFHAAVMAAGDLTDRAAMASWALSAVDEARAGGDGWREAARRQWSDESHQGPTFEPENYSIRAYVQHSSLEAWVPRIDRVLGVAIEGW